MGVRQRLLLSCDRFVVSGAEGAKAIFREYFRLGAQIANSSSAALMQVVSNDHSYVSRRNRVHAGPETQRPSSRARRSRFAEVLLGEDSGADSPVDERRQVSFHPAARGGGGGGANAISDNVSDTTAATHRNLGAVVFGGVRKMGAWCVQLLVSLLHLLLMWLPGMGWRAERLAKMLDPQSAKAVELDLEHVHTGMLNDLQTRVMLMIEWCCWMVRSVLHAGLGDGRAYDEEQQATFLTSNLSMRRFRRQGVQRRTQNVRTAIAKDGYPFQSIMVTTSDGYLLELHRLPRPGSDRVMFLQHGIMDSSYSFVANGASEGLAYRAFDKGYDVFMGNFRGTSSLRHKKETISAREYWDFTLDDHADRDLDAFVQAINRIKRQDLAGSGAGPKNKESEGPASGTKAAGTAGPASEQSRAAGGAPRPFDLTLVAHSMGAAASLIYMVNKCRLKQPHHLNRMVLMSPAGYHQRIPRMCRLLGGPINYLLASTVYTLSIPSERARNVSTQLMTDAVSVGALRDMIYSFGEMFLGGDFKSTVHAHVKIATDNVIAGTSSKVFKQFWNCYHKRAFLSFDYGPEGNLRHYGTQTPIDYMAHYHLIDVPIHFMAGQNDNLIPAKDIMKHYKVLHRASPSLATTKPFAGRGHLDFTYGLDQSIAEDIFAHAAPQQGPSSPAVRSASSAFLRDSPRASPLNAVRRPAGGGSEAGGSPRHSLRRGEVSQVGGVGVVLGQTLRITSITEGGPAARANVLRLGDELLLVGGAVVVGQPSAAVMDQIRGVPGSEVTIGFRRGSTHKKATLTRQADF